MRLLICVGTAPCSTLRKLASESKPTALLGNRINTAEKIN